MRGGMVTNLVHDIFERVRAVNGKTHKDQVGFRVRQRSQPVVLLLSGRVPESELHRLTGGRVCGVRDVILKDGWDVFLGRGRTG